MLENFDLCVSTWAYDNMHNVAMISRIKNQYILFQSFYVYSRSK